MISAEIDPLEWDRFVDSHPDATGYHLWQWRKIFADVFGHECPYLIARSHGRVTGLLPIVFLHTWWFGRFGISLPFVNYGGLVADDRVTANELIAGAAELAKSRNLAHLELRHRRRQRPDLPVKQHKVTMLLPLAPSSDAQWQRFDRKVRNQVRKAEKSDLQNEVGGLELLDAFYNVFARNMRDLGVPVHSPEFFRALLSEFKGRARVHLVRRRGVEIAGAITYRHKNVVEVPWASSLKEFLALSPNNLLYWGIIQRAISEGAETLDFGRSTPDEGTYHFKRQWGAVPAQLYWEYYLLRARKLPDQSPKSRKFQIAMQAWRRLPVRVSAVLGPSLVRGMPY
jgi:FemAB-related protein (PEP-CTERM system-associated)